jgi:hypothetical protein
MDIAPEHKQPESLPHLLGSHADSIIVIKIIDHGSNKLTDLISNLRDRLAFFTENRISVIAKSQLHFWTSSMVVGS